MVFELLSMMLCILLTIVGGCIRKCKFSACILTVNLWSIIRVHEEVVRVVKVTLSIE